MPYCSVTKLALPSDTETVSFTVDVTVDTASAEHMEKSFCHGKIHFIIRNTSIV